MPQIQKLPAISLKPIVCDTYTVLETIGLRHDFLSLIRAFRKIEESLYWDWLNPKP